MTNEFLSFFDNILRGVGDLHTFITVPLGVQYSEITMEPFASMSILGLLGTGLVTTLVVLLAFRLIRLIIGG